MNSGMSRYLRNQLQSTPRAFLHHKAIENSNANRFKSPRDLTMRLGLLLKNSQPQQALELFTKHIDDFPDADPKLFSYGVRSARFAKRSDKFYDIIETMESRGIAFTSHVYQDLLYMHGVDYRISESMAIVERAEKENIAFRDIEWSLSKLLSSFSRHRMAKEALQLAKRMRSNCLVVDEISYEIFLSEIDLSFPIPMEAKQFAQKVVEEMMISGAKFSPRSCQEIVRLYALDGNYRDSLHFITRDMKNMQIPVTGGVYASLMRALNLNKQWEKTLVVGRVMKMNGIELGISAHVCILKAIGMRFAIEDLMAYYKSNLEPFLDSFAVESMISILLDLNKWVEAVDVFDSASKQITLPITTTRLLSTYIENDEVLLKAWGSGDYTKLAEKEQQSMKVLFTWIMREGRLNKSHD